MPVRGQTTAFTRNRDGGETAYIIHLPPPLVRPTITHVNTQSPYPIRTFARRQHLGNAYHVASTCFGRIKQDADKTKRFLCGHVRL